MRPDHDLPRLADGCWVGRSGDTVLMAVGTQYFAAEDAVAADAIETLLSSGGRHGDSGTQAVLTALGLLTATPRAFRIRNTVSARYTLVTVAPRGVAVSRPSAVRTACVPLSP